MIKHHCVQYKLFSIFNYYQIVLFLLIDILLIYKIIVTEFLVVLQHNFILPEGYTGKEVYFSCKLN